MPNSPRCSCWPLFAIGEAAAEGLKPIEYTLGDGTVIRFSGQLNMGVLHYDDGQDDFTNFVDNENSSSRVRFQIFSNTSEGLEVRSRPWRLSTSHWHQMLSASLIENPTGTFIRSNIRKGGGCLRKRAFGKLWLGQGSMASDGTAEVDNSGTSVIAYSSHLRYRWRVFLPFRGRRTVRRHRRKLFFELRRTGSQTARAI